MQYSYQTPGPQGTLRIAQPELSWPLLPKNGARVVRVELLLNDEALEARYDNGAVQATPRMPLAPGYYTVRCRVTLSPKQGVAQTTWKFTVAPDALAQLPSPSSWAQAALLATNRLRAAHRLAPLTLDPRLCAAAQAHAAYLERNQLVGHLQSPRKPGFIGETPTERAQAFGYTGTLAEDVSYAEGTPEQIVRALFDAPYHRLPFLRPGSLLFGAGNQGKASGLLFGGDGALGTTTSPYDGETGVPTTWRNDESPSPTRTRPNAPKVLGYPIVLTHFSESDQRLSVKKARLTTAEGDEVECLINSPATDSELSTACLLVPLAPLKPETGYQVEIVTDEITRRWRFTTGRATETDFGPLDLRPGDLKLTGTLEKVESRESLVLRTTLAQAYGTPERTLPQPVSVTLQLSAQTRFVSQTGRTGSIKLTPGLELAIIVPNGPLDRPLPARTMILLR